MVKSGISPTDKSPSAPKTDRDFLNQFDNSN